MMRLLVSVRSVAEAEIAAEAGADFIDLKEPRGGALGGLPVATVGAIVSALRGCRDRVALSATIGDLPMHDLPGIVAQVEAVAACGVDYVKVGIERRPGAAEVLDALGVRTGASIVPVFIADHGLDPERVEQACRLRFPALMVDTADKRAGSLFDAMTVPELKRFVERVRAGGSLVGLAGALRAPQLAALQALRPDFAGFRSAVCAGDRGGDLDPVRLAALVRAVRDLSAVS